MGLLPQASASGRWRGWGRAWPQVWLPQVLEGLEGGLCPGLWGLGGILPRCPILGYPLGLALLAARPAPRPPHHALTLGTLHPLAQHGTHQGAGNSLISRQCLLHSAARHWTALQLYGSAMVDLEQDTAWELSADSLRRPEGTRQTFCWPPGCT